MDKDFYAPTTKEEACRRIEGAERDIAEEEERKIVMKEYEQEEETNAILEMDLSDEELEARLEAFFAEQRELCDSKSIPGDYITLEESFQKTIKNLKELYAKKKSRVNA